MVRNLEFKESTQHEPLTAHQKHHLFYKNYSIDGYVMDEYLRFDTGRPTPFPLKKYWLFPIGELPAKECNTVLEQSFIHFLSLKFIIKALCLPGLD